MKQNVLICFVIVIFLCPSVYSATRSIGVKPTAPTGETVTGDQWLFVIGINSYLEWPHLKTAVNDARAVRDVLVSRYHFDEDHLIELYDVDATRSNILSKLRYFAQSLKEDDSLVVFYAGHGYLDPITKEGSWIPVESGIKDVAAYISNHDIKNYLRIDAIKAKHVLLISDSCFSGDFFRGERGILPEVTDTLIKKAYNLTSRQAITSGGLEPVSDEGFGGNSVFSHFLIKTLEENKKPFLVPSDLFPSVKAGVVENAEQFPTIGTLKDTGGQQGGELVLFLKQDYQLNQLTSDAEEKQAQLDRLEKMAAVAAAAKEKEGEEIAAYEKQVAELDAKIEAMQKRLGTKAVQQDDSLDSMLAMVKQKEEQAEKLEQLRKQREAEEASRKAEIEKLQREQDEQIIAMLKHEVEKYKQIVGSEYGASMKEAAWQSLIAKCPEGWAKGVATGDMEALIKSPQRRITDDRLEAAEKTSLYDLEIDGFEADLASEADLPSGLMIDGLNEGKVFNTASAEQIKLCDDLKRKYNNKSVPALKKELKLKMERYGRESMLMPTKAREKQIAEIKTFEDDIEALSHCE